MSSSRKQYPFDLIEPKWQDAWDRQQTFRAWNPGEKLPVGHPFAARHGLEGKTPSAGELPPKHYVLDMFPYPSGAGLHVGHPEGYTATDILARYRRATGFNVLHPMGWDAFGLPAEQYAIKTGRHPRATTEANVTNFKRQIKSLGFSYDWTREVDTTDPKYFKWTQWIFLKLYNSYFDSEKNCARPVSDLIAARKAQAPDESEEKLRAYVDSKRLAFVSEAPVNWCPELGTVLANEEVIDGKSEVGGFPVVRRPMRQWMLRITAYAERLLNDLEPIDWSHSLKEMQRNWIGRSEGAEVDFKVENSLETIRVFTTRPDTLFGATYMVLAPEHPIINAITPAQWPNETPESWRGHPASRSVDGFSRPVDAIEFYKVKTSAKSDLERTLDEKGKEKTGVFTGAYAINPVNGQKIPIWIADYVLATYGTGAIMAVPAHDRRDFEFAKKFSLPIVQVVGSAPASGAVASALAGDTNKSSKSTVQTKVADGASATAPEAGALPFTDTGLAINSEFLNSLSTSEAKTKIIAWLEEKNLGKKTINYKLRDWLFSRQRYWGEPFPIIWKRDQSGNLYHDALPESALPLMPPDLTDFKPTATGEPPLARAKDWVHLHDGSIRETNTMPQWAGSCWYYLRYADAQNPDAFIGKEVEQYWMGTAKSAGEAKATPGVDLYVGGTEHAVLHLLYARFWHKVLFDLGLVSTAEPFFKLVNQGLILGEDGQKMSKSRGNVVNPDDILSEYGADAFRLYEMFMGPLEMVKPWNTKGVEGVYRFLGRVWRLFVDEASETEFEQALTTGAKSGADLLNEIKLNASITDAPATPAQLKTLHQCIKKVTDDLDGLRFNTAISALMVFINDAITWETKPRAALADFLTLLQPFAPHLAAELFAKLNPGKNDSLVYRAWPGFDAALLVEDTLEIPVQVNGKLRDKISVPAAAGQPEIEAAALACEKIKPYIEGKAVKKIIIVPKRLVNIVVV